MKTPKNPNMIQRRGPKPVDVHVPALNYGPQNLTFLRQPNSLRWSQPCRAATTRCPRSFPRAGGTGGCCIRCH